MGDKWLWALKLLPFLKLQKPSWFKNIFFLSIFFLYSFFSSSIPSYYMYSTQKAWIHYQDPQRRFSVQPLHATAAPGCWRTIPGTDVRLVLRALICFCYLTLQTRASPLPKHGSAIFRVCCSVPHPPQPSPTLPSPLTLTLTLTLKLTVLTFYCYLIPWADSVGNIIGDVSFQTLHAIVNLAQLNSREPWHGKIKSVIAQSFEIEKGLFGNWLVPGSVWLAPVLSH